jgi:hypothetical protein
MVLPLTSALQGLGGRDDGEDGSEGGQDSEEEGGEFRDINEGNPVLAYAAKLDRARYKYDYSNT